MKKFTQILTIIAAGSLLLAACGGANPASAGKTIVITPAIKGNSASLAVGDTLEIKIPTIPKEGFSWEAQELDTSIVRQEGSAAYTADTSPNSAGGMVTLLFKAVGAGNTTITLLYVKPATDDLPSVSSNSFSVTVDVK